MRMGPIVTMAILLLSAFAGALVILPSSPKAQALSTPVFVQVDHEQCLSNLGTGCTVAIGKTPVVGDVMIVGYTFIEPDCYPDCQAGPYSVQYSSSSVGSYVSFNHFDAGVNTPFYTSIVGNRTELLFGDIGYIQVSSSSIANTMKASGITMSLNTGIIAIASPGTMTVFAYEVNATGSASFASSGYFAHSAWGNGGSTNFLVDGTNGTCACSDSSGYVTYTFGSPMSLPAASDVPRATNNTAWIGISSWDTSGGVTGNSSFFQQGDGSTFIGQNMTNATPVSGGPFAGTFTTDITDSGSGNEIGVGIGFFVIPAASPVSSHAVTAAAKGFQYPTTCYSGGYYFVFYELNISNTGMQFLYTSSIGFTLTFRTPISIANVTETPSTSETYGMYCDSSGDLFFAYGASSSTAKFLEGTQSSGVISWGSAVTITCIESGHCNPASIFAYGSSSVYMGISSTGGYIEVWQCTVAPCTSSGNWANELASSQGSYVYGIFGFGTSSASQQVILFGAGAHVYAKTSYAGYGGTREDTSYAGYNGGGPNEVYPQNIQCVTDGSSNQVYCTTTNNAEDSVYYLTFTNAGAGTGTWTESTVTGGISNPEVLASTLSSDGGNVVLSYARFTSVSAPCPCEADYKTATSLTSPSWSGQNTILTTGEDGLTEFSGAASLQSGFAGLTWLGGPPNNIGELKDSPVRFGFDVASSNSSAICMDYKLIAGGSFDAPVLSYVSGGLSLKVTLKQSLQCVVPTLGSSWSVTNPLTGISSSSVERAYSGNVTSGTSDSAFNETVVYWHQLDIPVSYTISDSLATNHPTFTYLQYGSTVTVSNSKLPTPYWIDYNSRWTAESPFTTSPDFVTLSGHAPQGQAASLQPIIIAYYASSSCGGGNPLQQIENLCLVPGIIDAWSYAIGSAPWVGFILLGVNVAVYNKNQNVWLSLIVLWVTGAVFSAALPAYVSQVAQIFLYLGVAGLAVKTILLAR